MEKLFLLPFLRSHDKPVLVVAGVRFISGLGERWHPAAETCKRMRYTRGRDRVLLYAFYKGTDESACNLAFPQAEFCALNPEKKSKDLP